MAGEAILAIDVGAGTQDVLLWQEGQPPENSVQLVLPSETQRVARRVRRLTALGHDLFLSGEVMGGGASTDAVMSHIAAGYRVYATERAGKTFHDNLDRVAAQGVRIVSTRPPGTVEVRLGDVDLRALRRGLALFGIALPDRFAIAVFDHGDSPDFSNRRFRFEHLRRLVEAGGDIASMAFSDDLPPYLTRMAAARRLVPGAIVMDTGAAGIWGALEDPLVAERARPGAIVVNIGNMHTFAVLLRGRRLLGLFEHHSHLLTPSRLSDLVAALRAGTLDFESVFAEDGHGAVIHHEYAAGDGYDFVAVTGPNRWLARGLGWYEAAPHGNMMLAGAFGLVAAARDQQGPSETR